MNLNSLPFNWFDLVLLVLLTMGFFRGRKRGMSEELLPVLQSLAIVIVCAFSYQPLGAWLASLAPLSLLASYVVAYVLTAIGVIIAFLLFKKMFHGKLIGSDAFGKGEYYLGMPAGVLRFACALIAGLALLNARLYSAEEISAYQKFQTEVYGSEYFPGLQVLQANVFERSLTGPPIRKYLSFLLIKRTSPEKEPIKRKELILP
jgi:uncharacterized membrane protein required for colicin V production